MATFSKEVDAQSDCPLFKLAAETRNQIYELVYATETNEDGAVELSKTTPPPPSKALTMTCQQIHREAHTMYKAAYRHYPEHDFTLHVSDRNDRPFIPDFSNHSFSRINSVRVTWRADEHNQGKPLRLTTHFTQYEKLPLWVQRLWPRHIWCVQVEMHDDYCKGKRLARNIIQRFQYTGREAVRDTQPCIRGPGILRKEVLSMTFSYLVHNVVCPLPREKSSMW